MRLSQRGVGANIVMAGGLMLVGLMTSVFAIDGAAYFAAQNQLQTATDAAALAGAQALPDGNNQAEDAALELASDNLVAGQALEAENLHFDYGIGYFEVKGHAQVPTIINKLLCGFKSNLEVVYGNNGEENQDGEQAGGNNGDEGGSNCDSMTVYATSKAVPVARDTILVVDTSSSMDDLGHNQPFKDVKTAAKAYVGKIVSMDTESVDRIGVVSFNKNGVKEIGLTSQASSPGFASVKSAIDHMSLYSGSGWNTNFYVGLKYAMDELETNGRPNATKTIIFMTDGYPNLPGGATDINTCVSYYNTAVNYKNQRKTANANTYFAKAKNCALDYTNYMKNTTQAQVARAMGANVTIHVIQIGGDDSNSLDTLRTLLKDPNWESGLQQYIVSQTDGDMYAAANYDSQGILDIYEQVALNVRMKLSS